MIAYLSSPAGLADLSGGFLAMASVGVFLTLVVTMFARSVRVF